MPSNDVEPNTRNEKLDKALTDYFNGNSAKNAGATTERNAKKIIESIYLKDAKEPYELAIGNTKTLRVSYDTVESEEIDPKALFEKNPAAFWELVNVPMTNAKALLGDKAVAQVSRPVKETKLVIKKINNQVSE